MSEVSASASQDMWNKQARSTVSAINERIRAERKARIASQRSPREASPRTVSPHGDPLRDKIGTPEVSARTLHTPVRPNGSIVSIAIAYTGSSAEVSNVLTECLTDPDAPKGCSVVFGLGVWKNEIEPCFILSAFTDARLTCFIARLLDAWRQECAYVSVDGDPWCCNRQGWLNLRLSKHAC